MSALYIDVSQVIRTLPRIQWLLSKYLLNKVHATLTFSISKFFKQWRCGKMEKQIKLCGGASRNQNQTALLQTLDLSSAFCLTLAIYFIYLHHNLSLNGKDDKNQCYMVPVMLTSKALKNTTQCMENNKCCLKSHKALANEKLSHLFLKSQ